MCYSQNKKSRWYIHRLFVHSFCSVLPAAISISAAAETTTTVVVVKLTAGCAFRVGTVGASYLDSLCATIIAGLDKKLNGLSFTEGAKTFGLDSTLMDKEILTTSYEEKRNTKSALRL